jgi:hypothetical protein
MYRDMNCDRCHGTEQYSRTAVEGHEVARKRLTSAASAGGAAGASGVELQNRVFAWAAAMAAEQPLLVQNLVAGVVVRVGAQTGYPLDDVAVLTDAGNYALFQVKAAMSLGRTEESPLGKALGQAVEQYLDGRLPTSDGIERRVDPERDALVLYTDNSAPATVRVDLATALARTGSQPPGMPLGKGLTAPQLTALNAECRARPRAAAVDRQRARRARG